MSKRLLNIATVEYDNWEECLAMFVSLKKAQGCSKRTIEDYEQHVKRFFQIYPVPFQNHIQLKTAVLDYFGNQNVSPTTHNIRRTYLRAFFNWCIKEGVLSKNPIEDIPRRKPEPRVRHITEKELGKLLQLPEKDTFSGLRNYTMLLLSLDTGIRPKEMLSLMEGDIRLKSLEVFVRQEVSKTRTSRTLPISPTTAEAIARFLNVRPSAWQALPVFCSCEGRPLTTDAWHQCLRRYGEKIGIKISPYDLRHVFALFYLRNGGDVFTLQRIMGHTNISTTEVYVNLLQEDIKKAHVNASPVVKLVKGTTKLRKIQGL
jgi:site-specific recombinase XerD